MITQLVGCTRARCSNLLHVALIGMALCASALYFWEQHQAAEAAAEFKVAVRGAGAGQWYWDIDKNILRWDDRMFELFRSSKSGWENVRGAWEWKGGPANSPAEAFARLVIPEDQAMVMAALNKAVFTRTSYQAVFRVTGSDGTVLPIRAGGAVYGGGRYMTGLCMKFIGGVAPATLDTSLLLPGPRMLTSSEATGKF